MKPVEVRVASAVAFGGALVFFVVGLILWRSTGDADVLKLPSFLAVAGTAWRPRLCCGCGSCTTRR